MATITLDGNFTYLTNGTISGDTITINSPQVAVKISNGENGIDQSWVNEFIEVRVPAIDTPAGGGTEIPNTRVMDLLRIKEVKTVVGVLPDEVGSTAFSKLTDLKTLVIWGGSLNLVWGSGSEKQEFKGFVNKVTVKETTGVAISGSDKGLDDSLRKVMYNVNIQMIVGVDL